MQPLRRLLLLTKSVSSEHMLVPISTRTRTRNPSHRQRWCVVTSEILHVRSSSSLTLRAEVQVKQSSQYLLADIRSLLRQGQGMHNLTTSRSVARVLHGLSSNQVASDAWRQHPSWGKHAAVDFLAIMRAAEDELQSKT